MTGTIPASRMMTTSAMRSSLPGRSGGGGAPAASQGASALASREDVRATQRRETHTRSPHSGRQRNVSMKLRQFSFQFSEHLPVARGSYPRTPRAPGARRTAARPASRRSFAVGEALGRRERRAAGSSSRSRRRSRTGTTTRRSRSTHRADASTSPAAMDPPRRRHQTPRPPPTHWEKALIIAPRARHCTRRTAPHDTAGMPRMRCAGLCHRSAAA